MRLLNYSLFTFSFLLLCVCCQKTAIQEAPFFLEAVYIGARQANISSPTIADTPIDLPLELIFSAPIDPGSAVDAIQFQSNGNPVDFELQYANANKNIKLTPRKRLIYNTAYTLQISDELKSQNGGSFTARRLVFQTINGSVRAINLTIDNQAGHPFGHLIGISLQPTIEVAFSSAIDPSSVQDQLILSGGAFDTPVISFSVDRKQMQVAYHTPLEDWTKYTFALTEDIRGMNGELFEERTQVFYTKADETPKFPMLPDEELLTLIQKQTFSYFWEFGHPVSGLARERNTSNEIVTFGGSGFGLMAMIVAVERGFITLDEALDRWKKIIGFLQTADRFHGAFPHWMNGSSGKVQPFSSRDNGGDLVETAFFIQGLLTVRQYLQRVAPQESELIAQINRFWEEVEWDWFTKGENEALYWHWSPEYEWEINLKIRGHNETQIVYVLAAASPTHAVDKEIYERGYARAGEMLNGKTYYQITLPAGPNYGGPLFFAHYSYLGLDPRNLQDQYVNYWTQNVRHSLINHAYCRDNPKNYVGYSDLCWGLTASDNDKGYAAHSPNNDRGVVTPTAAISSIVYTPEESMAAIRHFYYTLGDKLWGEYGFYDAFNPQEGWVASSYLAIDQGPIICMIENYRTGLLWDLFMSCPEIQNGLTKLGFSY